MLFLARRRNERIRISVAGEIVWLTVRKTGGSQALLRFDANPAVVIEREELLDPADRFRNVSETQT